jgi:transposase
MAHKEYGVTDILDILRRSKAKDGIKRIVRATGMAKNTVRNYLRLAAEHGFHPDVADELLPDIAARVFRSVHGSLQKAPNSNTAAAPLFPHRDQISDWLEKEGLTLTKAHIKLSRIGVNVSYSTLYRYAREEIGFGAPSVTVRMADTAPGEVAQADFGRMGLVFDPQTGKQRVLHALVVTLIFSRHQYVYLTHRQDSDALITGVEEAWEAFGGVARRLIIDNMKAAVVKSDRYEPVFNRTFQEYSQYRGFIIDPAPARHPEAKGCVENQVKYVQNNFFAGEKFIDRNHAQNAAQTWCRTTAGLRLHGTTRKRPLLVFEEEEQGLLLPLSAQRFDVPVWGQCSVHRDHHVRFKNALYSVPTRYIGKEVEVKGTRALVRIYYQQQLIKTHPKVAQGKRSTDFEDYPKEKSAYAMRDVDYYIRTAKSRGEQQGAFMEKLLAGDVPWAFIRQAQALLRLGDKYGSTRVEAACSRALAFGLMNVKRVEGIITLSLRREAEPAPTEKKVATLPPRFERDPDYFSHQTHTTKENDHGSNC